MVRVSNRSGEVLAEKGSRDEVINWNRKRKKEEANRWVKKGSVNGKER